MIGINEEHAELAAAVRGWAQSLAPREAVRSAEGKPEALADWPERYAGFGIATIALAEPVGGGGTLLDQAVALEAAAHELVPGPLLSSVVVGLSCDDEDVRRGIADGSARCGLAVGDLVLDGPGATHVLAGEALLTDAATTTGESIDFGRPLGFLDESVDPTPYRRLLVTLAAAEAAGVARWCLETAVSYAKVREQFGKPIGSFQAIKHLCAEMLETVESVTAAAWDAARAAEETDEQWSFAAGVAETVCFDGAVAVAKDCIQVLGGIGFTFEHDAHLYLRRTLLLRSLLDPAAAAADLAALAASGVRRATSVDLGGRDADDRDEARDTAARIAGLPPEDQRAALADAGYLAPHWPAPYGLGADPVQQLVIDQELAAAGVTRPDLKIGAWAAPTILGHGSEEQRERFLGPTLRGEITWCQLFSEPEAGSDLASLRTKAVRDEDSGGWRVTGQKVWTSLAHEADWAICLVRTDPDAAPHRGITYVLLDMTSSGIDIRPLREITGEEMFNEVFLDDVFVPDSCVVGEPGEGWKLTRTTLSNERVAMAGSRLGDSVERAVGLASSASVGRAVAWASVASLLGVRATLRTIAGHGPGAESSVAKLVGVRSRQDSAELVVDLLGPRAYDGSESSRDAVHELLLTRCLSIAGGTTQILRNVAAERILGLPR
jgi:3-oxochol-4-en-24-oyl-CoA dehydrogenase